MRMIKFYIGYYICLSLMIGFSVCVCLRKDISQDGVSYLYLLAPLWVSMFRAFLFIPTVSKFRNDIIGIGSIENVAIYFILGCFWGIVDFVILLIIGVPVHYLSELFSGSPYEAILIAVLVVTWLLVSTYITLLITFNSLKRWYRNKECLQKNYSPIIILKRVFSISCDGSAN